MLAPAGPESTGNSGRTTLTGAITTVNSVVGGGTQYSQSTNGTSSHITITEYPNTTTPFTPPGVITTVNFGSNTTGGGVVGGGGTQTSKSTNVGTIAGGVVSGVVGLVLIALLGILP